MPARPKRFFCFAERGTKPLIRCSVDRDEPFRFTLGQGSVIRGWELGVAGMCVGETRRLTIPPSLAYGERGAGDVIPPSKLRLVLVRACEEARRRS